MVGGTVVAGGLENEGAKVGLVDEKGGPVGGGFFGGEGKARAVSSGQVGECTWSASTAPWHSAETSRVTGPMSTEPISSISTTEHTKLNSRFPHLMGIPVAGGKIGPQLHLGPIIIETFWRSSTSCPVAEVVELTTRSPRWP